MHYHVIRCSTVEKLEEEVNRCIREGYKPIGGIAIAVLDIEYPEIFIQAMVNKD